MAKEKFLFICQVDENGELGVFTKNEADIEISAHETDEEMEFKVIGRISTAGLTPDFNPNSIEWFDKTVNHPKPLIDDVVVKIIQKIINN